MRRTALAVIAICLLSACTEANLPTSPKNVVTSAPTPPANRQTVRGIMRSVESDWALEISDGAMVPLIGGPVETYAALEGKEVIVVGVYDNGALHVDSCATYEAEFSRR